MIYDCFIFFNEFDLLEIRLHELSEVVDKFVIVESTRTFQKKPKPLYFQENKDRFREFEDKIIHIVVDDFPGFFYRFRIPTAWDYENYQRAQISRGLVNCNPNDTIIISDVDEIPRRSEIVKNINVPGIKVFQQQLYSYFFDCIMVYIDGESEQFEAGSIKYWNGPVMLEFSQLSKFKDIRKLRDCNYEDCVLIENGGWHFTYFGGYENVIKKMKSFSHFKEAKDYLGKKLESVDSIKEMIKQGNDLFGRDISYQFVNPREDLPEYVLANIEKFSHHFFQQS